MKAQFTLNEAFRSTVDNGRGHSVVLDLPTTAGGSDAGAKAFELLAMSLAGCIGTIFAMMASKARVQVEQLRVELETTESQTIDRVHYRLYVKADATAERLEKLLDTTERTCPVGLLFHRAEVPFTHELVLL